MIEFDSDTGELVPVIPKEVKPMDGKPGVTQARTWLERLERPYSTEAGNKLAKEERRKVVLAGHEGAEAPELPVNRMRSIEDSHLTFPYVRKEFTESETFYDLIRYELIGLAEFWYRQWLDVKEWDYVDSPQAYLAFASERLRRIGTVVGEALVEDAMWRVDNERARHKRLLEHQQDIAEILIRAAKVEHIEEKVHRSEATQYTFADGSVLIVYEGSYYGDGTYGNPQPCWCPEKPSGEWFFNPKRPVPYSAEASVNRVYCWGLVVRINEDGTAQFQPQGSDETFRIVRNDLSELFLIDDKNPEPVDIWKEFNDGAADRSAKQQ